MKMIIVNLKGEDSGNLSVRESGGDEKADKNSANI